MERKYPSKEEYLNVLTCKKSCDVPFYSPPYRAPVGSGDPFESGPAGGGLDGFGVWWDVTPEGAIPSSRSFLLEDICDWEKVVHFPDLDSIDWNAKSEKDLANWNPENQVVEYAMYNSHFQRLTALMGFENGLCAMVEEPEACSGFMEAFTEYRLAYVRKIAEHYHPDVICNYDDVATVRGTFMSRAAYQELIKPWHKIVNDEIKRYGIIPIQHCCGKAESLIEDFIDEGAQCWCSVQPENDIAAALQSYGDVISICGGYDTTKVAGLINFTEYDIRKEVDETIDRYARYGSFILGNMTLMAGPGFTKQEIGRIIADEALGYGKDYYSRSVTNNQS